MLDVLRFWLDRGVDGFRVDALRQLIEDERLRDNPPNPGYQPHQAPYHSLLPIYSGDQPEVHDLIARMRQVVDSYGARLLISELYLPIERLVTYYGAEGRGVHLPTNFHLSRTPWQARPIAELIDAYEAAIPPHGWPNWVLGSIASRAASGRPRRASRPCCC